MAINTLERDYQNEDGQKATSLEIANGDLEALESIQSDYGVRSIEDVIAFAIGVLKEANGRPVAVVREDGRISKYIPAETLKKNGATDK